MVVGVAIPLHDAVTELPRAIVVGLTLNAGDPESSSTMVRTAEPGVPSVAPPVGLLRVRFTVSLDSATPLLSDRDADRLVRGVAVGEADGLRHRRVVGSRGRRAIAGGDGDPHRARAAAGARDRDRRAAAVFGHAVGRGAELEAARRQPRRCR